MPIVAFTTPVLLHYGLMAGLLLTHLLMLAAARARMNTRLRVALQVATACPLMLLHGFLPLMWTVPLAAFVGLWHIGRFGAQRKTCMYFLALVLVLCTALAQPGPVVQNQDTETRRHIVIYQAPHVAAGGVAVGTLIGAALLVAPAACIHSASHVWIADAAYNMGAVLLVLACVRACGLAATGARTSADTLGLGLGVGLAAAALGTVCMCATRHVDITKRISSVSILTRFTVAALACGTINNTAGQLGTTERAFTLAAWCASALLLACSAHATPLVRTHTEAAHQWDWDDCF